MKILKLISIYFLILCIPLTGCNLTTNNIDANKIISSTSKNTSGVLEENLNIEKFTLNVWSYQFDNSSIEEEFKVLFPKASINITNMESMDTNKIINSLAENNENTPDIVIYSLDYIREFNAINGFEDLLHPQYEFNNIKSIFNESDLNSCMSMDKSKLISLPFTQASTLAYYRIDILESLGIPTDPIELGNLMETTEGWLSIAKKLKEQNIYAMQWKDEFVKLALNSYSLFDKDMNLNIESNKFKDTLIIANEAYNLGLIGKYDLWTDEGRNAVRNGQIAILHLNKWGEDYLKDTAPDTAGKWGVTRLPLGLYSSTNTNAISIVSSSKYKQQAWKLVRKLILKENSYYNSHINEESEFLNGQKANLLYKDIANNLPIKNRTMLDDEVYSTFLESINNHTDRNLDINNFLNSLKTKLTNLIGNEQNILSKYN